MLTPQESYDLLEIIEVIMNYLGECVFLLCAMRFFPCYRAVERKHPVQRKAVVTVITADSVFTPCVLQNTS